MHCINCGAQLNEGAKFCKACGNPVGAGQSGVAATAAAPAQMPITDSGKATIKCGNCGYIGEGKKARNLFFTILAWLCVCFAPVITIIYFAVTRRYKCPKCGSTFVGVQNKEGKFVDQKKSIAAIILLVLVCIAVIGILAGIVLASLGSARDKAREATGWVSFSPVGNQFTASFPTYPTSSSKDDSTYTYNTYAANKGTSSFDIINYVYNDPIDVSNPHSLLQNLLNGFNNGIDGAQIVSSTYTTQNGYSALDFSINAGTESVKGRMILAGQVPYIVAEDYYPSDYIDVDYQKFLSSFSVK